MGVFHEVLRQYGEEAFTDECVSFFEHKHQLLGKVVNSVSDGKIATNIVKEAFKQVEQVLDDPTRGLKLLLEGGIPISRYEALSDLNKFKNPVTGVWEPLVINKAIFPNLFPSKTKVKQLYKEYKKEVNIKPITGIDFNAAHWKLDEWLEFMLTSPLYSPLIKKQGFCRKNGEIEYEVIIRGDGLKACGHKSCFLLATLGNFDILSKCVLFNSIVNFAQVSEKDFDRTRAAFRCVFVALCDQ